MYSLIYLYHGVGCRHVRDVWVHYVCMREVFIQYGFCVLLESRCEPRMWIKCHDASDDYQGVFV